MHHTCVCTYNNGLTTSHFAHLCNEWIWWKSRNSAPTKAVTWKSPAALVLAALASVGTDAIFPPHAASNELFGTQQTKPQEIKTPHSHREPSALQPSRSWGCTATCRWLRLLAPSPGGIPAASLGQRGLLPAAELGYTSIYIYMIYIYYIKSAPSKYIYIYFYLFIFRKKAATKRTFIIEAFRFLLTSSLKAFWALFPPSVFGVLHIFFLIGLQLASCSALCVQTGPILFWRQRRCTRAASDRQQEPLKIKKSGKMSTPLLYPQRRRIPGTLISIQINKYQKAGFVPDRTQHIS